MYLILRNYFQCVSALYTAENLGGQEGTCMPSRDRQKVGVEIFLLLLGKRLLLLMEATVLLVKLKLTQICLTWLLLLQAAVVAQPPPCSSSAHTGLPTKTLFPSALPFTRQVSLKHRWPNAGWVETPQIFTLTGSQFVHLQFCFSK